MTDLRDDLRAVLADRAGTIELPSDFADRVRGAATRHRRHRRAGSLVLAAAIVVVVLCGATLALRGGGTDEPTRVVAGPGEGVSPGTWVPMPDGPLSPRDSALSFAVSGEVLIFGGRPEAGCPPGADCRPPEGPPLTDGAAYDPAARTWHPIADTPEPILSASGAVIGDRLYLWATVPCPANAFCTQAGTARFLAYDAGDDQWTQLAFPDNAPLGLALAADGDRIVGYHAEARDGLSDLVYSPPTNAWTPLPADPLQPGFDRVIVGHDGDVYLFSVPTPASRPDPDAPGYYQAAVLRAGDDAWQVLPESPVVGFSATWARIGDLLVNPLPGPASDSDLITFPPGGALDTVTGRWSALAPPPTAVGPYQELGTVVGDPYIASYGFVFDAVADTWTPLPRPDGLAEQGAAAAWVGTTLVVWGGTAAGSPTDAGATWTVGEPSDAPGGG